MIASPHRQDIEMTHGSDPSPPEKPQHEYPEPKRLPAIKRAHHNLVKGYPSIRGPYCAAAFSEKSGNALTSNSAS